MFGEGRCRTKRGLRFESLEHRLCLSVGWDGPGQGSASLSYYVENSPENLEQAEVEAALEAALGVWADVADLTFTEASRPNLPDSIDFEFVTVPFDGEGGVLAHAYMPDDVNCEPIAGDVQFDAAETWEIGNALGSAAVDLMLVAVHEIGHSLGLEHSHAAGAVMAETVTPNAEFAQLSADDIDSILDLYAPASSEADPDPLEPDIIPPVDDAAPEADPVPETPTDNGDRLQPRFRTPWGPRFTGGHWFHRPGRFGNRGGFGRVHFTRPSVDLTSDSRSIDGSLDSDLAEDMPELLSKPTSKTDLSPKRGREVAASQSRHESVQRPSVVHQRFTRTRFMAFAHRTRDAFFTRLG